mmetsp:Transcript_123973/g.193515  ORF Transcript_123973/g.193515 Transcript_123973/m.193515 type:complete len:288 (-) Transcript_123973:372-1235(-)
MSSDPWDLKYLPMPLFLLISCVANGAFLASSVKRLLAAPKSVLSTALVAQAIAELCWAVPCFIQCAIVYMKGTEGGWYQGYESDATGCDIMGFYSLFSLVAGMGTTVILAFISDCLVMGRSLPDQTKTITAIAAIFALGLVYASLPLMGLHHYKYISPICYYDWYDVSHSVLILLWTVPSLVLGTTCFARAAWKRPQLIPHLCAFTGCWALWIPAAIIGLSNSEMPDKMMIIGGLLGHAQALVDPLLYGVIWNAAFPELKAATEIDLNFAEKKVEDVEMTDQKRMGA